MVKKRTDQTELSYSIPADCEELILPKGILKIKRLEGQPEVFPKDDWQAFFDAEQLCFPLQLRRWKAGDKFCPLGMDGKHKKIQDLFTDRKLSRFDKEQVWLLSDTSDQICWVVGLQIDDRFKIATTTKAYYQISFRKHPK